MTGAGALLALAIVMAAAGVGAAAMYRARWLATRERLARTERERADLDALIRDAPAAPLAPQIEAPAADARLREMLGLTRSAAGAEDVRPAFAGRDADALKASFDELSFHGSRFAMTLATADGGRWLMAEGNAGPAGSTVWFTDVTEREEARRHAEARAVSLGEAVDALPLPVWRRGTDLRLAACNRAYADAVQQSARAVVREQVELQDGGDPSAGQALAECARRERAVATAEKRVVLHGERRCLHMSEVPLSDGTFVGMATDRTRADELSHELRRLRQAQQQVLDSLDTGVVVYGADLRVRYANGAVSQIWDVPDSVFAGEPHVTDVIEALRERRRLPEQADFRAYKRDCISRMQNLLEPQTDQLHCPDGRTLQVRMIPHALGGVLVLYDDVTDRLSLERDVNTLMEVQRETIDHLYEGVAVFGADGRLTLCNQAYTRIWHLSPATVAGRPHVRELLDACRDLLPEGRDDWRTRRERLAGRASEPDARGGRMERPDGSVLDWSQVPLPDGQSLFTYLDVTDTTRVERALRERAEALATADRLKSEFIANVSYELRTPLTAIVGFAEILQNQFFGELNTRQEDYARAIVTSSQRLIGLVNDILDLATIEAGYMELERETVSVAQLFDDLYTLAHERARSRGLRLMVSYPPDIGTIEADPRRLKQALFNLLSNAFNFTPDGGQVTLAAERTDGTVRLSVSDTGVGIRDADQARVLEKFERGHPRKGGPGLGLSLVKSLIELHGGRVAIDSQPDAGTRITCELPAEPDSGEHAQTKQVAAS
ncbi:Signal transduction histidine kinase [Limimonas halophila]|uniref:histidine kinase n=1 Tax=Limimonas halophila TaxID=1082479 RepID=A0A1G7TZM7_9PROT|nr:PAS domain-containing sensor histidine kinase [Limimonas halophila]SDG40736.1 Signal transduction histidine kinase [Limimonas halophila]